MYKAPCDFRQTHTAGLFLFPADDETPAAFQGELRVSFRPIAYYPPEPDVGAGADFQARITRIDIRDIEDGETERAWHRLDDRDTVTATAFLELYYSDEMWQQAFEETAEAFGAVIYYRTAA